MLRDKIEVEEPEKIKESKDRLDSIQAVISKYKEEIQHALEDHEKEFPFKHVNVNTQISDIFTKREHQVGIVASQLNMNDNQASFFNYLLTEIYDKKDEKTSFRANRDFIYSLSEMMTKAKNDGTECYLIKLEAYNFSSLNEILSHHGNDILFKQLAEIAGQHLNEMGSLQRYSKYSRSYAWKRLCYSKSRFTRYTSF